jgi:hypothetical protein
MNPKIIDEMILAGVVEVSGLHKDTGEFLYSFSPDLPKIDPKLNAHLDNLFYGTVMHLWEKGFVSGNIHDENPVVSITKKGLDSSVIVKLNYMEKAILNNLKQYLHEE